MKKTILIVTAKGSVSVPDRMNFLNKTERHAVLATAFSGKPYISIVAFALTKDMKGAIFATPKNTRKYRNLIKNKHVALLIDNRKNTDRDYAGAESVSILGTAKPVRRGKRWQELSHILIRKHPALKKFIQAQTTALILLEAKRCVHVSQFQMVSEWRVR
jgi:nitroimidazol reductase NimA-like FMN-containing flavoprotein (pyridoxamine 5'-phosphate oxidase superfamily)